MASDSPKIVAEDEGFRIVRVGDTYVTEVFDGADALGVERWRHCDLGKESSRGEKTIALRFRDYIIKQAVKRERANEPQQSESGEHSESSHPVV